VPNAYGRTEVSAIGRRAKARRALVAGRCRAFERAASAFDLGADDGRTFHHRLELRVRDVAGEVLHAAVGSDS
jgi:hypothetical protein